MLEAVLLPHPLRREIEAQAAACFPDECCGLIEGAGTTDSVIAQALHPTRNLAEGAGRFEIDPAVHVRLLRSLRGTGRGVIGCYHSHPNGLAEPSAHDRRGAAEYGFVWLIQAVTASGPGALAAFVFEKGDFRPLALRA